jgi:hypothetical protein
MPTIIIDGISEADLRVAVWMSNQGKTKKAICEYLKIKYNTTRLAKLLEQFKQELDRQADMKKAARGKKFTDEEKDLIVKRYIEVGSMAKVADEYYVSAAKIKNILLEKQVPIKSRKTVLVDHIHQDLDTAFNIGDIVFSRLHKTRCEIKQKYDEDYVEKLKQGSIKTIDNPNVPIINEEEIENVHYNVYWILEDGTNAGLLSGVQSTIKSIEKNLAQEGQEFYKIKVEGTDGEEYFAFSKRGDLYKV